ncbi:MAG: hypothetical protein KDD14_21485 [Saprospiraceae bacterium]|nr:hypothetical protein [Saprospiraceae bacterium]
MNEYIVDTNVPLAANGVSTMTSECMASCIIFLEAFNQGRCKLVIDGQYQVLGEYQHKLNPKGMPGIGDRFLRWVLTNQTNPNRIKQVNITPQPPSEYAFAEFPETLEPVGIDNSDKKFIALAKANQGAAPIVQAADSKWIGWVAALQKEGIEVEFPCYQELQEIFQRKMG